MIELNKDNFNAEVLEAAGPVVVDFWGERCEPCRALMPEVERLAAQYGDQIKVCKLNTTEHRRLAISQRVLGLPAIVVYSNGERVKEISGAENCSPEALETMIKEYIYI
jgi:thioredoxin 1